ncbi:CGNR zinc finger domain-containing protein [Paenibacillus sedimenti]|uniref:CGNR zinc finger domain-containing protein n=1 Tax=Paenibacillus sedimenti TaxID=2770274 RepID=A0A926QHS6_9BACL|nr:CGNR zinc finger domain-containing protein [Paenibacillus sedimenti]MBD0379810.1 CGNR zinc finger domain-containing protein [Paenibacillus sedimenti]
MPKKITPTFYFIGNHPILDFINTKIPVDGRTVDLLETFANVLDWLCKAGLFRTDEVIAYELRWGNNDQGTQVLEAVTKLRSSLLTIIEKGKNGEKVPESCIENINNLLKEQTVTTKLIQNDNGFVKEKHVHIQTPLDILIPIAEAAGDFFSNYDLALVKKCENPECVLYFYDNSKNSTRRWCSQKTCGNRMKVTAYLERQRNKNEAMGES